MAIIAAEQHQLILDAFDESDDVLRIARRLLSNRHNRPEVRRTVALFLGDEAPDDLETMQKLYGMQPGADPRVSNFGLMTIIDRIVVLENNIPERRTYTTDLKDNPWASPNRPFPRHSKVHVTFARVDKPPRMNMMRERKSVKLASAKRGQIAILPIVYEDPKYSQLIRNIEPSAGLDLDDVLKCITKTLIHQKTHALLNSTCTGTGRPPSPCPSIPIHRFLLHPIWAMY